MVTQNSSTIYTIGERKNPTIISFYSEPSLSFMVLSLFVSVMMLVLLHCHSLESLWLRLGDLCGPEEGKILPEITEEEGPVSL